MRVASLSNCQILASCSSFGSRHLGQRASEAIKTRRPQLRHSHELFLNNLDRIRTSPRFEVVVWKEYHSSFVSRGGDTQHVCERRLKSLGVNKLGDQPDAAW